MVIFFFTATVLLGLALLVTFKVWHHNRNIDAMASDAEWQVLLVKRKEIEEDTLLPAPTKEALRNEWTKMADAFLSKSHSGQSSAAGSFQAFSHGKWIVLASGILAIAVYALIGRWDAAALQRTSSNTLPVGAQRDLPPKDNARHPGTGESLEERIAKLEEKLKATPNDLEGWVLLARSRSIMRDFPGSAAALEKALAIAPGHPDILADLADVLAMSNNKSLAGRPLQLIRDALKSDPEHQKALSLAATAAMQNKDFKVAAGYWKRLRATFPPGAPDIAQVDAILASIGSGPDVEKSAPSSAVAAADAIEGTVQLSAALLQGLKKQPLPANATLFVVAKSPSGPPMPVAVARMPAQELAAGKPVPFRLDDSQAMSPSFKLSSQAQVDLEARISLSGNASKQPGDLYVTAPGVKIGSANHKLIIQSVLQ